MRCRAQECICNYLTPTREPTVHATFKQSCAKTFQPCSASLHKKSERYVHESRLGSFQSYDISFHMWPVVVCLIVDVLPGKKPPSNQILYMQRIQSHTFVVRSVRMLYELQSNSAKILCQFSFEESGHYCTEPLSFDVSAENP